MPGQKLERVQNRRRGSTESSSSSSSSSMATTARARMVEVAGTATAECAAVWCCCPCGIANLILFTVYRIPAGICRRAIRSRRQRRKMTKGKATAKGSVCECDLCEGFSMMGKGADGIVMLGDLLKMKVGYGGYGDDAVADDGDGEEEVRLLEEEMWRKFYATGFWRSPSRIC